MKESFQLPSALFDVAAEARDLSKVHRHQGGLVQFKKGDNKVVLQGYQNSLASAFTIARDLYSMFPDILIRINGYTLKDEGGSWTMTIKIAKTGIVVDIKEQ